MPQPGQAPPDIGTVQVRRYDTPRAAVAALLREDVDVLYEVPSEARALLEAEDGVHVFPHVKPYVDHARPQPSAPRARRGARCASP